MESFQKKVDPLSAWDHLNEASRTQSESLEEEQTEIRESLKKLQNQALVSLTKECLLPSGIFRMPELCGCSGRVYGNPGKPSPGLH